MFSLSDGVRPSPLQSRTAAVASPRRRLTAIAALWLPFLCGGWPAHAQDVFPLADETQVRALVEEALSRNPAIRAARERALSATRRPDQAAALPDPMVSMGYDKGDAWLPGGGPDTGPRIAVSQELPGRGKRRLLRDIATRDAELSSHAISGVTLGVTYAVRRAVSDLLLARENIAIIQDQRRAMADIEELTRARYSAGLATQLDVLRAQAELARFDQMRAHEEGVVTAAIAEINRERGQPSGTPVDLSVRLTELAGREIAVPPLEELLTRLHGLSPEVRAALTMIARDELELDLAKKRLKPDFVVSSGYALRGSLPDRFTVDVGVILPAYRKTKQRQAIAEAEMSLQAARSAREAEDLRVRSAVERAHADFKASVIEARTIEKQVLVIDALAVESALAGFRSGQTPFIAVLEATSVLYEDRRKHAELLYHVLWHSALLDALGMERQTS